MAAGRARAKSFSRWASSAVVAIFLWAPLVLFATPPGVPAAEVLDAFTQTERMGRGVNILGYDPIWKDQGQARFRDRHFRRIRDAGFQTVRINLHAFDYLEDGHLEPAWLDTLDWAVERALDADLMVILDLHNFHGFAKDPDALRPRLMAFWRQISDHYRLASDRLIFEILNEPNGDITSPIWNELLAEALVIIREQNPVRKVIVGPTFWNSFDRLEELKLPEDDRNLIATFHYYHPMEFTHQGAPWMQEYVDSSGIVWGSELDRSRVRADFEAVRQWAEKHQRPILLGEFGAYDHGPLDSRVAYTDCLARTAESMGFAWTYWQFDSDFIAFDMERDAWFEPILRALVPATVPATEALGASRSNRERNEP